jgi:O-antigen/teichoic acid export membrane protein
LRVYGVEGWSARRWIAPSLRFTVGTSVLAIAIIVGWALFIAPDADTRFDLLVMIPVVLHILTIEMLSTKYRLEDRYARMAGWQLAIPVSRLLVALVLLLVPQLTGRFVATSYAVISLAMVAWALPLLRSVMRGEIDLRGHGPEPQAQARVQEPRVSELWSQAWPFGMIAILYPVFFQVSTILLKYLGSDKQAGFWSIGLAVMTAIYLIPATIYQKFLLSKIHRWAAHDPVKFWMVYRRGNVGMFALGILVSVALDVVAPYVVPLVFGEAYRGVVAILIVLSLCPPIRFLSTAMGSALLTDTHMRYRVYAMAWATAVAILLNAALIPNFGVMGAAWATVTAELVLLVGTWHGVRQFRRAKGVHP